MMPLNQQQLKDTASRLFTYFEFCKFENELTYCRRSNLVLSFCDYIASLHDWELLDELQSTDSDDAINFRKMINQGADYWLDDLIKTISF